MSDIPIKPCPFCGGTDLSIDEIDMDIWSVVCEGCGANGPAFFPGKNGEKASVEGEAGAVVWWNKRPAEGLAAGICEALNSGDGVYRP